MRSVKLVSAIAALALVGSLGLAGCGSKNDSSNASASETAKEAGFNENPIEPDQEAEGQINVALVYFQPVDMEPAGASGLKASDASFHLPGGGYRLAGDTPGLGRGPQAAASSPW